MDFISNKKPQILEMLAAIGVANVEELFGDIPANLRCKPPAANDGLSEMEGMQLMESIAAMNTFPYFDNYLGAGAYEHHVPAIVGAICSKSEFLTSYTPYQPEASQGMLQIIFEFQSAVCALTGLDVANASVYDGANSCAEGMLMSLRLNKDRNKIYVAESLHPHYRGVVDQYLGNLVNHHGLEIHTLPFLPNGQIDLSQLKFDSQTAAVLVQSPNFLGIIEDVKSISAKAKEAGALTVLCANPMSYGLYGSAAENGVDIAVGDTQPFGLPLQFGGPYVGYISCRQELVRQMPGRIVGETVDTEGRRGFVLTLQAREQHIRREKATSNICSNQNLAALASLIAILWYGKQGVGKLALTNFQRASYLRDQLSKVPGISLIGDAPFFNEFVVKFEGPLDSVQDHFREARIEPGLDLGKYFDRLSGCLLVAVTETKSREQMDRYVAVCSELAPALKR
jgi:glycine dehydrogenase subunit 1